MFRRCIAADGRHQVSARAEACKFGESSEGTNLLSEDTAEGLEPVRVRQAPQNLLAAELKRGKNQDLVRERHHALEKIARCLAAMEREMCVSGAWHGREEIQTTV